VTIPGQDTYIVDEYGGGGNSGDIDRLFLLDPNGPMTPTVTRRADHSNAVVNNRLRAYFEAGGRTVYLQGYDAVVGSLPSLTEALALLPEGPGQVLVPDAVTSTDHIAIANATWEPQNKVALLNGPAGANDAALTTLAAADIAGADMRGAALFGDHGTHRGIASGATVTVPWTLTVAGHIARNDRRTRNANIAAAGLRGIASSALGVQSQRTPAQIEDLADAQVNMVKSVSGQLRTYGFRSLADLDAIPVWKSFASARLVMQWRSIVAAINENYLFDQIDGQGALLARYQSDLSAAAHSLWRRGALYGATPEEAYKIDTSEAVNPVEQLRDGEINAETRLRVSEFVEHVVTTIVRRDITAAV
jgi:hypothetical protein